VLPAGAAAEAMVEAPAPPAADEDAGPAWFVHLVQPAAWEERREIVVAGTHYGQVAITSDPDDEIAEIWQEFRVLAALLLTLTSLFVVLVVWSVTRALRPLGLVQAGLGRLAAGDFAASLPSLETAELEPVGRSFNRLADSLRRITADNHLLIGKLISLQESERSQLAHELHDELGPCLFGIRAQAACVIRAAAPDEAVARARTIQTLTDDLQRLNRNILGRLHPMALADLGLAEAVRVLMEDWRERCPAIAWEVLCDDLAAEPDGLAALAVYRIIQECLTNAARHSRGERVVVELASGSAADLADRLPGANDPFAAATLVVSVVVRDDGVGLAPDARRGFGLLGMAERAHALGGMLRIDSGGGVVVQALIPFAAPAQAQP
ncbi:MAG TPA: histidine kinase, partial [Patescibacteria group bacterium]|nr:histidine kinase [Patescibacteria group bacterium]